MNGFNTEKLLCILCTWLILTATAEHSPVRENNVLKLEDIESLGDFALDDENDVVPETDDSLGQVPDGLAVTPEFLEAHYYGIYGNLHTANSANAFRPGHVTITNSCEWIRGVPDKLRDIRYMRPPIPSFYQKYTEAYGIPVIGSKNVPDEALQRACYVLRFLLADIRLLREKYFRAYGRVSIMAQDEKLTQLPEYKFLPEIYNNATRGLGAIHLSPVSSGAEENVLCYPNDPYLKEDILIREIALGIYNLASKAVVPDIEEMLEVMYANALESGWWKNTYAENSKEAYLGEGIQSFFDVNGYSNPPDGFHNRVNTRIKLMQYDVYLYRLLERLFPCHNNYLSRCWARGRENQQDIRTDCYGGHMPKIFPLFF